MKTTLYSFIAAVAALGFAQAQTAYTTPVGYVTQALNPSQFTLAGVTVQNPTVAAGVLDAVTSAPNTVTDNEVNFTTLLTAGTTYILELPSGVIQEVSSWTGSVLTTPQDISTSVVAGTTAYKLRAADTVSSVFGATNSVGLTPTPDGDFSVADKILVPSAGGFTTVAYFNDGAGTEGWLDDGGNLAADLVMNYGDGFFVQRVAGSALSLVISGEVKIVPTSGVLNAGYNYLNGVAPVGLTLDESGLDAFLTPTPDGDFTPADLVLLATSVGGYVTCAYFNDGAGTEGWLDDGGNLAGALSIEDGFLIFNKGAVKPYTVNVPASYSNL